MGTNAVLLAEYATLMNRHGPDSVECMRFIFVHRENAELVELARISYCLKKGFQLEDQSWR